MTGIYDVVRQIQMTGDNTREWQAIVDSIAAMMPGCGVMLVARQNGTLDSSGILHSGYPAGAVDYAAEKFLGELVRFGSESLTWRAGEPLINTCDRSRSGHAVSSPRVRDWGARFGFVMFDCVQVWEDARCAIALRIDQPIPREGCATAVSESVLAELARHLRIAFFTIARLKRAASAVTLELFDRLAVPCLAVDERGNLVGIGELARTRLLPAGIVLVDAGGVVRMADARESDAFHRLLMACATDRGGRHMMQFTVPHQNGPNVLECIQVRAGRATASVQGDAEWTGIAEPWIFVQFRCRSAMRLPTVADARVLGLSKTEAKTAIGLVEGLTAEEQASARGVSAETARWHAKNIYERLDCDRAEMARLMFGLLEPRQGLADGGFRVEAMSGVDVVV